MILIRRGAGKFNYLVGWMLPAFLLLILLLLARTTTTTTTTADDGRPSFSWWCHAADAAANHDTVRTRYYKRRILLPKTSTTTITDGGAITDRTDDDAITDNSDIAIAGYRPEYSSNTDNALIFKSSRPEQQQQQQLQENHHHQQQRQQKQPPPFSFGRFQSPAAIQNALARWSRQQNSFKIQPFHWFQGKDDGRQGYVSSTNKLGNRVGRRRDDDDGNGNGNDGRDYYCGGGDWVLAQSQQVAPDCTTQEVLRAYLSGDLQTQWNAKQVLRTKFTKYYLTTQEEQEQEKDDILLRHAPAADDDGRSMIAISTIAPSTIIATTTTALKGIWGRRHRHTTTNTCWGYYIQDLVLHSQRIIRTRTGIMRYSQKISIDQIGGGDDHDDDDDQEDGSATRSTSKNPNYCVSIRLADLGDHQETTTTDSTTTTSTTELKPFEFLSVQVGLEQKGSDVHITAAGLMKVNRKVVPNLVVFDASGIAGSMAGKGTLWLAAHFTERKQQRGR
jgi:hypothetical protein